MIFRIYIFLNQIPLEASVYNNTHKSYYTCGW